MSFGSPSDDRGLAHLFDLATPALYRRNAFRVLGLQVGAKTGEARRRQKKLKRQEAIGLDASDSGGILPLPDPPSREELQYAQQRIQDPLLRLVEEFFWFWPRREGEPDQAIEVLQQGNLAEARRLFEQRESDSADLAAIHNLAILDHLAALDYEKLASSIQKEDRSTEAGRAWSESLRRWRRIVETPATWQWLRNRGSSDEHPQLKAALYDSLQSALTEMILLVSVRLAVHEVEANRGIDAARHLRALQAAGFMASVINKAMHRSLAPIDQRIRIACQSTEHLIEAKPEECLDAADRLLEFSAPLIKSVDGLLPLDDFLRIGVHDVVAKTALRCLIAYGNKTDDWHASKQRMEMLAEQLDPSESIRLRITDDLKIASGNAAFKTCHFCGQGPAMDEVAVEVHMHGDVHSTMENLITRRDTWRHSVLRIPRCRKCHELHAKQDELVVPYMMGCFGTVVGCITLIIIIGNIGSYFLKAHELDWIEIPLGLGAVVCTIAAVGYVLHSGAREHRNILEGAKERWDVDSHPAIVALLSQGWAFGASPTSPHKFGTLPGAIPSEQGS